MRQLSIRPGRETCAGRVLLEGRTVHIPDRAADPEYQAGETVTAGGNRAMLGVPLLREGLPIGVFTLIRSTARPFTEKQIELAATFADQAVIAIENVRLFEAEQQRTRELSESLEQQTATSEVLKVISSSPGELEPVFNAMLENATRICEAKFGVLFLYEGDAFRVMALHGAPPAYAEERHRDPRIGIPEGTALARIVETRQTVQVADIQSEPVYSNDPQRRAGIIGSAGARTLIMVPMLKDEELIGAIAIFRQEVRPFTNKQIELVTNFAAQAVIAIENGRLLTELRQRTTDLTESLEELRTTQDRLVQTQKLALLGQLTAGIAHEIKNPLNFVNNFSGVSAELIDELQEALKDVSLNEKRRIE
ncbi:MAG: GAF domain-containing protein, partial [Pseudolabrys sp.]